MPRVERVLQRSLEVKTPTIVVLQGIFSVLSNIPSFYSGNPSFPDLHPVRAIIPEVPIVYLLFICSRPENARNICHWTFSIQQLTINQSSFGLWWRINCLHIFLFLN